MKMFTKAASGAMLASLLLCGAAFAKTHNVNVLYAAKVGSHLKLAPGNYRVAINNRSQSPEAAFYKHGKLVGEAPVKLVSKSRKIGRTEVYYGSLSGATRPITQIEMSGWRNSLVFGKS